MNKCKPRKCKWCAAEYYPWNSLQNSCSVDCAILLVKDKNEKLLNRSIKTAKAIERKDIAKRKEKLKSRAQWIKELQSLFNKFIRLRDRGNNCISCGKSEAELKINSPISMVCGHYLSVGAHPEKRFTEFNGNLQCTRCNGGAGKYGQFNNKAVTVTEQYRINLIDKIGQKNVDLLEMKHEPLKLDIDQIKELKKEYSKKIKEMLK